MALKVVKSGNKYRTGLYKRKGAAKFCIVEKVAKGVLLTEFNTDGEVLVQLLNNTVEPEGVLKKHFDGEEIDVTESGDYVPVRLNAECGACKSAEVVREIDTLQGSKLKEVPVIPLYVCTQCKKRYYTLSDEYLRFLVGSNLDLFEDDELKGREQDETAFIKTLQEYVIRIFAAKKISRIAIKR